MGQCGEEDKDGPDGGLVGDYRVVRFPKGIGQLHSGGEVISKKSFFFIFFMEFKRQFKEKHLDIICCCYW